MSLNNPKTGIAITGQLLGAIIEKSQDGKYTNYRLGISTESRPDKFGQVVAVTNEIELTENLYNRLSVSIASNLRAPVRIWVDLDHRAGEKNGRIWEILNLRMRQDSEIEFLNNSNVSTFTEIPNGIKKG